jgi:ATP-dependent DNA helicase RecG
MNDEELLALLRSLESDRVERKASLSEPDRIREAICAFANDMPNHRLQGVIFIGVNNDGSCSNLRITDQLLLTLSDMRSDGNTLPLPNITVQARTLNGCEMAVVIVEPSYDPPVRFRGRTYIRIGPRRAIATIEEERRLVEKRRSQNLPFDLTPVRAASLGELDSDLFRRVYLPSALAPEIIERNDRSLEDQLSSLRFTTTEVEVGQRRPTVVGILVVGKDPREHLPGAYVQFLRIEGVELTDAIKNQGEISGPLPELLQNLDKVLQANISIATDLTSSTTEIRRPDYPLAALQQLTRNAILHRNYDGTNSPVRITWFSDRIEIQNPGGPFGQVNRQNFGQPGITDYRNAHLAEAIKNLGYVQRFGVGIAIARKELERNENPELEYQIEDGHILAIVRKRA